jgi:uncharacterized protein YcbK (DUF882 family)
MQISKNFKRYEFACQCGCGFDAADKTLVDTLEDVREHFVKKYPQRKIFIKINSGNRCLRHNIKVGGATRSKHLYGMAVDFIVNNVHSNEVADYLENKYPDWFGIGRYDNRTHLDSRVKPARWDMRTKK